MLSEMFRASKFGSHAMIFSTVSFVIFFRSAEEGLMVCRVGDFGGSRNFGGGSRNFAPEVGSSGFIYQSGNY